MCAVVRITVVACALHAKGRLLALLRSSLAGNLCLQSGMAAYHRDHWRALTITTRKTTVRVAGVWSS
jgi:hypothetical protein